MLASESEAGDAHQSGEIRKAERRTTAEIATRLAEHLTAVASRKDEEAFPTASAARELCRDLGLQSSKQGPYLRIGMLLHSKESEGFLIKPHAPGLPSVTLGKRPQDHLIGSAVLYPDQQGRSRCLQDPSGVCRRGSPPQGPRQAGRDG